jgi:hypothetical protein
MTTEERLDHLERELAELRANLLGVAEHWASVLGKSSKVDPRTPRVSGTKPVA